MLARKSELENQVKESHMLYVLSNIKSDIDTISTNICKIINKKLHSHNYPIRVHYETSDINHGYILFLKFIPLNLKINNKQYTMYKLDYIININDNDNIRSIYVLPNNKKVNKRLIFEYDNITTSNDGINCAKIKKINIDILDGKFKSYNLIIPINNNNQNNIYPSDKLLEIISY